MSYGIAILLSGIAVALGCSLGGVFLVLRRRAMIADAISHAVLPGLVAAYVLARGPNLLAGVIGAAVAGLVTVVLVELLTKSRRLKEDSAIGLVFPALFALGVLFISNQLSDVHIDADSVLTGTLEFASLDRWMGAPVAMWTGLGLLALNALFLAVFYKELKLTTFDPDHARTVGLNPAVMHYALMTLVAITAVVAFSAVGAILAVALIVVPAATAILLARRLGLVIALSLVVAAFGAGLGQFLGELFTVSISGMIAVALGLLYLGAALLSPRRGLVAKILRQRRQERRFAAEMLAMHLLTHEGTERESVESTYSHLIEELEWTPDFAAKAISAARGSGTVRTQGERLFLTDEGRDLAERLASPVVIGS